MAEVQFAAAVTALADAVDLLLSADLSLPGGTQLTAAFATVEIQRRRLEAFDHALVMAVQDRGLAGDFGQASVPHLLGTLCRLSPREATARVKAAHDLGPRRDLGGAPLSPVFALVAEAQGEGAISAAHARVITACLEKIPAAISVEAAGPAEAFLVEQARQSRPAPAGA